MLRTGEKVFACLLHLRWNFVELSSKPRPAGNPRLIVRLSFGDCVLDADRRELSRGGMLIHTGPRVFDLLAHLVVTRERVVSKDELLRIVWGGRLVSDSTLTSHIHAVRKVIGDSGDQQKLIRTVSRKGFRFVGEVKDGPLPSEFAGRRLDIGCPEAERSPAPKLPDKPSIAVLPFKNLSGDPGQEYFADGIVEEITTAIARLPWLFVIARDSSFTYKGKERARSERLATVCASARN